MADATLIPKLILGNKTYSSWSLRGWLAVRLAGLEVEEVVIFLHKPETRAEILKYNAAGKVPALVVGDGPAGGEPIWDSLAIGEYLAERFPEKQLWPADAAARRLARCVVAEMHSGFAALRGALPMDLKSHFPSHKVDAGVQADIDRVQAIWRDCRGRFGQGGDRGGDFLFGKPSLADAFYAPVATRFRTYDVKLDDVAEAYCAAVEAWPLMRAWTAAAAAETEVIAYH
jgi:glutathione S-transferase